MAFLSFLLVSFVSVLVTVLYFSGCSLENVHTAMKTVKDSYITLLPQHTSPETPISEISDQQVLVRRETDTNLLLADPYLTSSAFSSSAFIYTQDTTSTPSTEAETSIYEFLTVTPSSTSFPAMSSSSSAVSSSVTSSSDDFFSDNITGLTQSLSPTLSSNRSTSRGSTSRPSVTSRVASTSEPTESTESTESSEQPTSTSQEDMVTSSSVSQTPTTLVYSSVQNGSTVVVTQTTLVTQGTSQPSSSTSKNNSGSSSGLSNTNKIVVGVVVGVGGAVLIAFAALAFILKRRSSRGHESGWTFWRKNEKGAEDNFFSGELGVRDRDINQGSNF